MHMRTLTAYEDSYCYMLQYIMNMLVYFLKNYTLAIIGAIFSWSLCTRASYSLVARGLGK